MGGLRRAAAENALPLAQFVGLAAVLVGLFLSPLPAWSALLISGGIVTMVATWLEWRATAHVREGGD